MQFQTPLEIGHTVDLTKLYDDTEGFIDDGRGNKSCHVKGRLVHVADLDRSASAKFGRECLTWRLAIASTIMNSMIKDVAVQIVKSSNIHSLRSRFPGAFDEYESRYGVADIPKRVDIVNAAIPAELIAAYDGPDSYEEYMQGVRNKTQISAMGVDAKRAQLQAMLDALDAGDAIDGALEAESEFAMPATGQFISTWDSKVPVNARKSLMAKGVMTVEQFAGASDALLESLGAGQWNAWREVARKALNPKG